jgi:hypothetical protein
MKPDGTLASCSGVRKSTAAAAAKISAISASGSGKA